MNGILSGGWSFVYAAYGVSALFLVTYSVHTINDFRRSAAKRAARNPGT
ncbi:MAG: hypothetical protein ABI837_03815 [Acidobacteriota bacterium]